MKPEEFDEIYKKYFDLLYRVCYLYMRNDADALDMVQDVFVKVLNGKVTFISEEKLKSWLIVTASNNCKSQLKKWWYKKRNEFNDDSLNQLAKQITPEHSEVLAEVLALEDKYRIPVYLHYYEGYSTLEIGQMLKISPSTIQTRLAKARELLKMSLSEEDDASKPKEIDGKGKYEETFKNIESKKALLSPTINQPSVQSHLLTEQMTRKSARLKLGGLK